jgi:hypothetical protein
MTGILNLSPSPPVTGPSFTASWNSAFFGIKTSLQWKEIHFWYSSKSFDYLQYG